MTPLILNVDLELLRGFGALVDRVVLGRARRARLGLPRAFEHFADQGVELIQIDRVSQQRNIGDPRSLVDLYGRLSRQ